MNYLNASRTRHCSQDSHGLGAALRRQADRLATTLLPQSCAICGAWAGGEAVCARCAPVLPRLPEPRCPTCSDRSPAGDVCARCAAEPHQFDRVVAALAYAPPVDDLIQSLKYGHQLHLARWFGNVLADRLLAEPDVGTWKAPIIIPMPLHPERLAERGFNQAAEISRTVARRLGQPLLVDACVRVRATAPQTRLGLDERRGNVRNAFECRQSLSGHTVILVDDVLTSGASLDELARTARMHGATRIIAAVVGRTLHG